MKDLDVEQVWVVALVEEAYPIAGNVQVVSLDGLSHQPQLRDWLLF